MLFVVRFEDKPNSLEQRKAKLDLHLAWLDEHKANVLVGGSLRHSPEAAPEGGLWIVEASSREDIMHLIETDPFWLAGLRESVEILHWSKAFADRQTLV